MAPRNPNNGQQTLRAGQGENVGGEDTDDLRGDETGSPESFDAEGSGSELPDQSIYGGGSEQGAEGEGEDEYGEGGQDLGEEGELPRQQPSRRDRRIQALLDQAQQDRERTNRLERELAETRQRERDWYSRQQQVSEEEQLAYMTPEQRVEYRLQQARQQFQQEQQRQQIVNTIQQDKNQFDMQAMTDPRMRRMAPQVEAFFQEQFRQGRYVPREAVYAYLRGQEVIAAERKPKREASPELRRQQVRAPNSGNDEGRRSRREQSVEDRLSNIKF